MSEHFILRGHEVVPVGLLTWALWLERSPSERIVKQEEVGPVRVSTVFLGLDHGWGEGHEPQLFETLVFGGPLDEEMTRCATYDEAEKMHEEMVLRVKAQT